MKISRRKLLRDAVVTGGGLYVASLFPGCSTVSSSREKSFRAGVAAIDITPGKFPISVNGMMSDRIASRSYDPLHARCMVLDNGQTSLAIVVVDSLMMTGSLIDKAKSMARDRTGIPVEHMTICATHTHAAPSVVSIFQSEANAAYCDFLVERIAEAIASAQWNLQPAKIGWARTEDPTQTFCRLWRVKEPVWNPFGKRTDRIQMHPGYQNPNCIAPAGPTDPEIVLISVQSHEGRPIGLLANYTMHYAQDEPYLSADYFGEFCRQFAGLIDAGNGNSAFVAMLCNGAQGDAHCFDYSKPKQERTRVSVAQSVANEAYEAYKTISYHDWVPLRAAAAELKTGVRLPSKADVDKARRVLAKVDRPVLKGWGEIYSRETVLLHDYPAHVDLKLQALRIGDVGIGAMPVEAYASSGLAVKAQSPFKPTFVIDLANGYNGYMPPPAHFELGGYSTWRARSSYLQENTEPRVIAKLVELLKHTT